MEFKKSKRDIDKEIMFNKIMPTHLLDPNSEEGDIRAETVQKVIIPPHEEPEPAPKPEPEPQPEPKPKPKPRSRAKAKAEPEAEPKPRSRAKAKPEPAPEPKPEPKPAPEPELPRYINLTQRMIFKRLNDLMEKFKCCQCESCRQSILLYALNSLPPNYVYQTNEEAEKTLLTMDTTQITTGIIQAILKTRASSGHSPK